MRLKIFCLILCTLIAGQVGLAQSPAKPQAVPEISANARFRSLDLKTSINLADYRGKVVVLGLWASWCAPCRLAVTGLGNLHKEFADSGVEVIALTIEKPQTEAAEVSKVVASLDIDYKLGWISKVSADRLTAKRNLVPQVFIVKDGVILKRFLGWNSVETLTRLRKALDEALGKNSNDLDTKAPAVRVGIMTRNFSDEQRKDWQGTGSRPLRTTIWYPAATGTGATETIFGGPPERQLFSSVTLAGGAELSQATQKYPLVLLSHGTGGSAVMMMWLGYYLAERGYIVAAVNHHGNTSAEKQPAAQGFLLFWERSKDLTAVLNQLLADPVFGVRIDQRRIGAAGFSLGGYTVISAAGGVFSLREFDRFCHSTRRDFTCEPQAEFPDAQKLFEELKRSDPVVQESLRHAGDSYRDRRIKRVFAIAPALGSGFTRAGLSRIRVPVSIVVGQADGVAPPATNARRYASLIKGATLTVLPGKVGHYTFLAACAPFGKTTLPICRDGDGVDRAAVHRQVSQKAFEFFEKMR